MKTITLIFYILFMFLSGFAQTDKEVIEKIKNEYYHTQGQLDNCNKYTLNDTLAIFMSGNNIVKAKIQVQNKTEEYFYYPESNCPYFVFSVVEGVENRYYYDVPENMEFGRSFVPITLVRWLDSNKVEVPKFSPNFYRHAYRYLLTGVNIHRLKDNDISSKQENNIDEILSLSDSLSSLHYILEKATHTYPDDYEDELEEMVDDHEKPYGREEAITYISADKAVKMSTETTYIDCMEGFTLEQKNYTLNNVKELIIKRETIGSYLTSLEGNNLQYSTIITTYILKENEQLSFSFSINSIQTYQGHNKKLIYTFPPVILEEK